MNLLNNLICSATRVAPAVLTWATRCVSAADGLGVVEVERVRLWASETGESNRVVSRTNMMRFNLFLLVASVVR
jgi:hypothetical protein